MGPRESQGRSPQVDLRREIIDSNGTAWLAVDRVGASVSSPDTVFTMNRVLYPSGTCNDEGEVGKREVRVSYMDGWRTREERSVIASRRIADRINRQAWAVHECVERGSRRRACGGRWEKRTNRRVDPNPKIHDDGLDRQVNQPSNSNSEGSSLLRVPARVRKRLLHMLPLVNVVTNPPSSDARRILGGQCALRFRESVSSSVAVS